MTQSRMTCNASWSWRGPTSGRGLWRADFWSMSASPRRRTKPSHIGNLKDFQKACPSRPALSKPPLAVVVSSTIGPSEVQKPPVARYLQPPGLAAIADAPRQRPPALGEFHDRRGVKLRYR